MVGNNESRGKQNLSDWEKQKKKRQRLWNCQRRKTKPLHDILHEEKYNTGVLNVNSDWPQSPGKYLTSLPEDKRTLAQAVSRLIRLCEAQLPQGNKAALWLSITALVQGQPSPECRRFPSHIITEEEHFQVSIVNSISWRHGQQAKHIIISKWFSYCYAILKQETTTGKELSQSCLYEMGLPICTFIWNTSFSMSRTSHSFEHWLTNALLANGALLVFSWQWINDSLMAWPSPPAPLNFVYLWGRW